MANRLTSPGYKVTMFLPWRMTLYEPSNSIKRLSRIQRFAPRRGRPRDFLGVLQTVEFGGSIDGSFSSVLILVAFGKSFFPFVTLLPEDLRYSIDPISCICFSKFALSESSKTRINVIQAWYIFRFKSMAASRSFLVVKN
jgi:hypothetical protein